MIRRRWDRWRFGELIVTTDRLGWWCRPGGGLRGFDGRWFVVTRVRPTGQTWITDEGDVPTYEVWGKER